MESVGAKAKGTHYAYVVLLTSALVALGALGFGRFSYPVILPAMKQGLNISYEQAGLIDSSSSIGYLALSVIAGFVASRFGPRKVISVSMALLGVSLIGTGFAPDFFMALVMRILTGIGSGGSNVPVMALASAWFASSKRGLASGVITGGIGMGLFISGIAVPGIISGNGLAGWRYAWYFLGALVLLISLISFALLRNRPQEMGLAPVGEPASPHVSPAATSNGQGHLQSAKGIYRMPVLWHLAFIYVLFGFSYITYSTFFAAYLTREGGLTAAAAGSLWALAGLLSVVSGSIWGMVSDIWGRKYGLALVFLVQAISFFTFAAVPNAYAFYASAILFGLTAWSIPAIMAAACGDYGGPRLAPAVLGSITLFFGIGQALGPAVGGRIADVTGSFAPAFFLAAAASTLGALASLVLRPQESKQQLRTG